MRRMCGILFLALALCAGCSHRAAPTAGSTPVTPDLEIANAAHPGERLELSSIAVKGKTTLCEFYSDNCPPCKQMEPVLEFLASRRPDLAIRRVNIDRPGQQQIDFHSPLAEQWRVESVPSFCVYDDQAKLVAQGDEAKDQVKTWYSQAQMFQQAEANPETRAILKDYESK